MNVVIHCDGGSRGTTSYSGATTCGIVIRTGEFSLHIAQRVADGTNNFAEYSALIIALEQILILKGQIATLCVRMDSDMIVRQVRGEWKAKKANLIPLRDRAQALLHQLDCQTDIQWIPRERNQTADALANEAYKFRVGERRERWVASAPVSKDITDFWESGGRGGLSVSTLF